MSIATQLERRLEEVTAERDALSSENDSIWETLVKVADMLGIDPEQARKVPGKPGDVYANHLARLKDECQREAYLAGWMASGEGDNSEYPGDSHLSARWEDARDKWIESQ